jgi:hypothetical protein
MSENYEAVKGEEAAPCPLFTYLPTRWVPGKPHSPGPSGLPLLDRGAVSGLSLHRTGMMAMLHTLRGQLSHAERVRLLLVPREAGDRTISPAFLMLSPGPNAPGPPGRTGR